ncbi:hypothetical protein LWC34_54325 [Kibdelosporangium philippinense]|uniref:Uncharacterized protein n=2 Tax=Kibdelosporangium philippinense TaxID=211113 RepID=A0ABS8ZVK3_9PSEU|nr:hypothetical protein [Kibdelosporangium philippinense]MCE7011736.1 hypothetical protein [Kibdelosporangium philippinense]
MLPLAVELGGYELRQARTDGLGSGGSGTVRVHRPAGFWDVRHRRMPDRLRRNHLSYSRSRVALARGSIKARVMSWPDWPKVRAHLIPDLAKKVAHCCVVVSTNALEKVRDHACTIGDRPAWTFTLRWPGRAELFVLAAGTPLLTSQDKLTRLRVEDAGLW